MSADEPEPEPEPHPKLKPIVPKLAPAAPAQPLRNREPGRTSLGWLAPMSPGGHQDPTTSSESEEGEKEPPQLTKFSQCKATAYSTDLEDAASKQHDHRRTGPVGLAAAAAVPEDGVGRKQRKAKKDEKTIPIPPELLEERGVWALKAPAGGGTSFTSIDFEAASPEAGNAGASRGRASAGPRAQPLKLTSDFSVLPLLTDAGNIYDSDCDSDNDEATDGPWEATDFTDATQQPAQLQAVSSSLSPKASDVKLPAPKKKMPLRELRDTQAGLRMSRTDDFDYCAPMRRVTFSVDLEDVQEIETSAQEKR
eukprot:SAG22_NODE_298_length_12785_cov_5.760129_8_plen_309_part_00